MIHPRHRIANHRKGLHGRHHGGRGTRHGKNTAARRRNSRTINFLSWPMQFPFGLGMPGS